MKWTGRMMGMILGLGRFLFFSFVRRRDEGNYGMSFVIIFFYVKKLIIN